MTTVKCPCCGEAHECPDIKPGQSIAVLSYSPRPPLGLSPFSIPGTIVAYAIQDTKAAQERVAGS